MKNILVILLLVMFCSQLLAQNSYTPQSVSVGTNSTLIIPATRPTVYTSWATSVVYSAESIVSAGPEFYWCVTAGTSTNITTGIPSNADGDSTDGTVTWRRIHTSRNRLALLNDGDVGIAIANGTAAVAGKGQSVAKTGGTLILGDGRLRPYMGAIYGIVESGTNAVTLRLQEE